MAVDRLKQIADEATAGINALLDVPFRPEQAEKSARIIEEAVIKALLEGQHRAVDAAIRCSEAEQDLAHKIASAIRQSNDALIANLTSLR
jgi:hypothetical protein